MPSPLDSHGRVAQLEAMVAGPPLDVLVVGGGVTGVGVALDAAARGLRVGIVERDDWGCGTSSRSSKMIHGGLRYLATGDVGVVRESLRERVLLQRNAAHLVRPLPMALPVYGRRPIPWQRAKLGAGLWAYELLGHHRASGRRHRWLGADELAGLVPAVARDSAAGGGRLRGALQYHDASADDARLVLAILRTASSEGALAANGTPVLRLLRDGERVCGAVVGGDAAAQVAGARDGELEVEARVVVNATGVWADATLDDGAGFSVLPSKGIHLTVPRSRLQVRTGIAFFEQSGNANVFIEPWQDDLAFIGTTDTPYDGALDAPTATDAEVSGLLSVVNAFLDEPLASSDVVSAWAGLRPLVVPDTGEGEGPTKDISRRHLVLDRPGIVTVTGGKLTAYRAMAEQAVDAACHQLAHARRSRTRLLPLDGCRPMPALGECDALGRRLGMSVEDAAHLVRRHGSRTEELVALAESDPELRERVHPERPYIGAEVAWSAMHEQVRDVEDVLARRTRIALEVADPGEAEPRIRAILDAR